MSELYELQGLEAGYGDVKVLWGISLKARRGELTTIVGANGAGKTTALRAAVGSIPPFGGRVLFDGEDVTGLRADQKAARGIVLVPEGRQLFATMSVEENLEMGAYSARARGKFDKCLAEVFELFPRLRDRRRQIAGTFSGGEQQMLAIARGLMSAPEILIIDELSLGLAPVVVHQLFNTLKALKQAGLSILLVEQNVHLAFALAEYAYVMAEGKLLTEGKPAELVKRHDIRQAYLGL